MRNNNTLPAVLMSVAIIIAAVSCSSEKPKPIEAPATRGVAILGEITTLNQLAQQPLLTLGDGQKVRLGIGPMDTELGPWRVVYCQVEGKPVHKAVEVDFAGDLLGPVVVHCVWENWKEAVVKCKMELPALQDGVPPIYQRLVAFARSGRAVVRVLQTDGTVLAELPVNIPEPPNNYWRAFSQIDNKRDPVGLKLARYNGPVVPQLPDWPAMAKPTTVPSPQPAQLPSIGQLKLSLENNMFVVDATPDQMGNCDDRMLLARWWVNGEPMPPDDINAKICEQSSAMYAFRSAAVFKVAFGLPSDLQKCVPGDRIGVQVLYSPGGWRYFSKLSMMQALDRMKGGDGPDLAISNRLEFTLTAEQLKLATEQKGN